MRPSQAHVLRPSTETPPPIKKKKMVWVKAKTHLLAGTKSGSNMGATLPHPPRATLSNGL